MLVKLCLCHPAYADPPQESKRLSADTVELAGLLVNAQWLHRHLLMDKYRINLQAVLFLITVKEDKYSERMDGCRGDLQTLCRLPCLI